MQQVSGWSEQGGSVVTIPGTQGSGVQRFQQSFRAATVTVRDSSNNLATIYSDDLASPTAKANPFTASSTTGAWAFFVVTGTYSVTFSGGSITAPFSITVNVGLGNAGGVPSYAFASLPTSKSQNAGDLARVTNTQGGLWMDSGVQWVKQFPAVNVMDAPFNARGDGSTDDTAAIQAAIDAVEALGGGMVFFPARTAYYKVASTLVISATGVTLVGAGAQSQIIKTTAGDILQVGDGITGVNNTQICRLSIQGTDAVGWAINCNLAPNTIIADCTISCSSTGSGGVNLISSWDSRVTDNTFGSIKGTALQIASSSNATAIKGNRIDGSSIAAGIGIVASALNLDIDGSNVIETIALGIQVSAPGCRIGAYFENYVRAIQVSSMDALNLTIENATFSAPDASAADAINLNVVNSFRVINNNFDSTHTNGAPITIGSSALNGEIGQNTYNDPAECTLPADLGNLNINLWSERPYFSPRNLFANSFEVWPGGTVNSPPSIWQLFGGAAHTRESDAPIGRYSIECVGSGLGIQAYPFPLISTTVNASLRGRYAVFTIWAKSQSGTLTGQLRFKILDGVSETNVVRTLTTSWAQYTIVRKLDAAATLAHVVAHCANAGTIRLAAPAFYVGSTVAVNGMETPQYSGMICNDQTDYAHTGTTNITAMKTETILGTVMGNGGAIRVWATGTITGTAGQKDITLRLGGTGGTALATVTEAAGETGDWAIEVEICNTAVTSQRVWSKTYQANALESQDYQAGGFASTNSNWTIDLCGDLGDAGDTITVKQFVIEAKNGI